MAEHESPLIERIAASNLISRDDLDRWCSELGDGFDDQRLIDALLRRGLLTKWQIAQIQAGRTQNLVLGRYKLLAPLGAGGMGTVFRAFDPEAGRQVAVKILAGRKATPDAVGRFRRESLAALEMHHENVVQAFGLGQQGSIHYLVMELIDGPSLGRYLSQRGRLTVRETARIGYEVALALDHAFRQNIIHRDIKPSNILLSRDGQVKLADLGLAKFFGQPSQEGPETRTGQFLGTIDYCSPEQCEDAKRADIRSDIYSLGCTLYHCLTGKPPFGNGTEVQRIMAHLERMPDPIHWSNDDVPAGFAHVIERQMLAKNPADRFTNPAEAAEALRPWATGENGRDNLWAGIAGLDALLAEVELAPPPPNMKPASGAPPLHDGASPQPAFKIARRTTTKGRLAVRPVIYAASVLFLLGSIAVASRWWTGRDSPTGETPSESTTDPGLQQTSAQTSPTPSAESETVQPVPQLGDTKPAPDKTADAEEGFDSIFDGHTLNGWQMIGQAGARFTAEEGKLIIPETARDNLFTLREYGNFVLRFDFLLEPGANSGVGIRAPLEGVPAFAGMEVQILDDRSDRYSQAPSYQYHGSLWGFAPAKRGATKPAGEWNSEEIRCDGDRLVVTVNGQVTLDIDLADYRNKPTPDNKDHPGLKRTSGHIVFVGQRSRVEFRNIRIKELPPSGKPFRW